MHKTFLQPGYPPTPGVACNSLGFSGLWILYVSIANKQTAEQQLPEAGAAATATAQTTKRGPTRERATLYTYYYII